MSPLYTSDRKKGNELLLLFTVWMVVWAAEASVDADHVDNHPLLHGEALVGEGGRLEAGHHRVAVLAPPGQDCDGVEDGEAE